MPFPYIRESIQAGILSATSNILAQGIKAYREDRAFALDTTPVIQFVTYAMINTPLNCAWQEWLEAAFPGSTDADASNEHKAESIKEKRDNSIEKSTKDNAEDRPVTKKRTLNVKNTAIKFALDQTIGAAYNTIAFITGISALRGLGWDGILAAIKNDSLPIYLAGVKLWPAVSLLSFTVIPVERRVIFGSIVGVGWGIFLSLQVGK